MVHDNRNSATRLASRALPWASLILGLTWGYACANETPLDGGVDDDPWVSGGSAGLVDSGLGGSPPVAVTGGQGGVLGGTGGAMAGSAGTAPLFDAGLFDPLEPSGGGTGAGSGSGCEGAEPGVCDWTRLETCCADLACEYANGTNIYSTYEVETCQKIVDCLQTNSCSSAADPLCGQRNGAETSPCTTAVENAGTDENGPGVYTLALVNCVCGY